MNAAGIVEEKSAGGFNAFLYESINTRLMVVVSMAVHLPVRSFRMASVYHPRQAVLRSSSHTRGYVYIPVLLGLMHRMKNVDIAWIKEDNKKSKDEG